MMEFVPPLGGRPVKTSDPQRFFSSSVLCSSSASSAVFTRISSGIGLFGFFSSMGGFGAQTTITLFLPRREHGMDDWMMMFNRMFPDEEEEQEKVGVESRR